MAAELQKRELMFEAELLNQQIEQVQQSLAKLERQATEVLALKVAIDDFSKVVEGEELLVPLAAGIFARATATGDTTLRVNIGQGVVVEKTPSDVHAMLDQQLAEIEKYSAGLQDRFDKMLMRLQELQAMFEK